MEFRYDFVGDKLDLSRFRKQVNRQLTQYEELNYAFYVLDYKIQVNINLSSEVSTNYLINFSVLELKRDSDGEISSYSPIRVAEDLRFKEFPDLVKHYLPFGENGYFESNSVVEITDILFNFIKIIYKINNLKAFL